MKKYFYEIFILDTENNVVIEYYLRIEVEDTYSWDWVQVWNILIMVTGGVNVQLSTVSMSNVSLYTHFTQNLQPMIFWLR